MAKKAGNKAEELKQGDMAAYEEKQKLILLEIVYAWDDHKKERCSSTKVLFNGLSLM